MQSTNLLENLNSDLLSAYSALLPKNSPQRVLVYVESDEDIAFWRNILHPFEAYGVAFDIHLPCKNGLEKGKRPALERCQEMLVNMIPIMGPHLIVCIDSDYDYLLQDTNVTSATINQKDFIFQTYSYSIENLKCYAYNLHAVCVQSTKNDTKLVDFEGLMKLYSNIIYEIFLWSVLFRKKGDTTSFPLSTCCQEIKILTGADLQNQFNEALLSLKGRVNEKIQELETRFPEEKLHIKTLSEELSQLGIDKDNAYLFAQGHTIRDNVVLMFLKPIVNRLKSEKRKQICLKAKHSEERNNQKNAYDKQIIPIENALDMNTEFKSCFLYEKINKDLKAYIQRLNCKQ